MLLAHAVGRAPADLLTRLDDLVTEAHAREYDVLVRRRERREPVAYIVREREFYGLKFVVDGRALIPRPETELLVEEALAFCNDPPPRDPGAGIVVADVGTGSGCIVVSVAAALHGRREVRYIAVDISADAVEVARLNARRHGVDDRIDFRVGDALAPLAGEPVDLIVANPPYVPENNVANLQPEITLYEPEVARNGGSDGLRVSRRIIAGAPAVLNPGGALLMEMGYGQADTVVDLAQAAFGPGARIDVQLDLAGIPRVLRVRTAG